VKSALRRFDVPVSLGADRYAGAREAAKRGCNAGLLDDGFQHWRLARDLDIVLIDASDPFGGEKLVPHGLLREPLAGLARAGVLVVTRSEHLDGAARAALLARLKLHVRATPVFFARHALSGVRRLRALSDAKEMTLADVRGLRAIGACGIGNPDAFWTTARDAGAELLANESFADHHAYGVGDVERLAHLAREKKAQALLVPEKDAVKLEKLELPAELPFLSLRVEFQIENFAELWPKVEAALHTGDLRHARA
jgi:tetraacyldisaccharide 4'-kinase